MSSSSLKHGCGGKNRAPRSVGFRLVNRVDRTDGSSLGMTYARIGLPVTCRGTWRGEKAEVAKCGVRFVIRDAPSPFPMSTSPRTHLNASTAETCSVRTPCSVGTAMFTVNGTQNYDPNAARDLEEHLESIGREVPNNGAPTLLTAIGPSAVYITACPGELAMESEWKVLPVPFSNHLPTFVPYGLCCRSGSGSGSHVRL